VPVSEQKPSVGRIVHYVSHGTPVRSDGSQAFTQQCRAAVVTEVDGDFDPDSGWGAEVVGLCVLNPIGQFFHALANGGCEYDGGGPDGSYQGGTWHWPERV
jgi:hypothetical protein